MIFLLYLRNFFIFSTQFLLLGISVKFWAFWPFYDYPSRMTIFDIYFFPYRKYGFRLSSNAKI